LVFFIFLDLPLDSIEGWVDEIRAKRQVQTKNGPKTLQEMTIKDEEFTTTLTFWEDAAEQIQATKCGDRVAVNALLTRSYMGNVSLTATRETRVKVLGSGDAPKTPTKRVKSSQATPAPLQPPLPHSTPKDEFDDMAAAWAAKLRRLPPSVALDVEEQINATVNAALRKQL
jgi:hypothetical protein